MTQSAGGQRYTMPTYNSEGMQVWDPSVGLYFKPAADNAQSFGGVVGAIQDQIALHSINNDTLKAFPYSFAGIIAALQALTVEVDAGPAAEIGDAPPDILSPLDGTLWFDTRQGRMFVAFENEWYQTNGADGLPIVTEDSTPPSSLNLPDGQLWWDASTNILYLFEGTFWTGEVGNSSITKVPADGQSPVWIQVSGPDTGLQTTATLPLVNAGTDPDGFNVFSRKAFDHNEGVIPTPDPATLQFQEQANLYLFDCISSLDQEVENQKITMSPTAPENPVAGQLWFDVDDIEMSIWYVDSDGGQWVPTYANFMIDAEISTVKASIADEVANRTTAFNSLQAEIDTVEASIATQTTSIDSLAATVATLPTTTTLADYSKEAETQGHLTNLQKQISSNVGEISAIHNTYMLASVIDTRFTDMVTDVNTRATKSELSTVEAKIPTNAATTAYVDNKVASQTASLPLTGGTLSGAVKFTYADTTLPTLDFTGSENYGRVAQKYRTYCAMSTPHYASFGTTANLFEYAWDFESNEDFCYKSNGTKVASIDKNGIAATALKIASFGTNDANGRALLNTIDIGDTLTAIKSAVNSSSDYATLKSGLLSALANV